MTRRPSDHTRVARSAQQEMQFPFRHGGAREGAGRPRKPGRRRVAHVARPRVKPRFVVHVTVRVKPDVARLRNFELCAVLRSAFIRGRNRDGFRICQFSIQGNHLHLICEARDTQSLSRGVQGWSVRVARGLNRVLGRAGSVFEDRYHCEVITTPRQLRGTLCYVLQNARRHGERIDRRWNGVDPFSSAWWFDGWRDERWKEGLSPPTEPPVARARTWLLKQGWRRWGLLAIDEVPAARRREDQHRAPRARSAR
jgi:REP element-mobilizing transposase RayT